MLRSRIARSLLALAAVPLVAASFVVAQGAASPATAATTAGCGKTPTLKSGTQSISSGGQNRTYVLRIPDGYSNSRPYRLIFGLHWLNGSANDVVNGGYYGQQQLSNNSAILVAPQGLNAGWANSNGQDLALIDAITARIEGDLCVDTSLVFATGWSYGGSMSYALACDRAAVFRAVVVISGAQLSGCSSGTQPVAYLGIHGLSDNVLAISNGRSLRDRFVRNNGCTAQNPPEPAGGSGQHIVTYYSGCRSGYPVGWAAFDGGHQPDAKDRGSSTSWVPGETWKFFSQFASTSTTTTTTTTTTSTTSSTSRTTTTSTTGTTSTTSTTSRTTTTTGGGSGGCTATATTNQWQGGFVQSVTVQAAGTTSGWRVTIGVPSGASITNAWNASLAGSSGTVTATNVSYNGNAAGGGATFGFQGTGTAAGMTFSCTAS